MARFELYRTGDGYRWRLISVDGRIKAASVVGVCSVAPGSSCGFCPRPGCKHPVRIDDEAVTGQAGNARAGGP